MTPEDVDLKPALERYFGFSSFRPHQEAIIRGMPLAEPGRRRAPPDGGGGKSLCFQLPAVVRPGLTLVVSPLIALMKDQVDALQAAGVAATFLNSSPSRRPRPERRDPRASGRGGSGCSTPRRRELVMPGFVDDLRRWDVRAIAVDEAHCISAWGHDFRPEYRRIAELSGALPHAPVMALTATATPRVRDDIVASLRLRAPRCHVASFDRPNLFYRVEDKSHAYEQLLALVRRRAGEHGIVYGQSRDTAERLAARLVEDGVSAAAYHAGLGAAERARTQEAFARDEVKVVCATSRVPAWGSTSRTHCASWSTTTCRRTSRATTRRRGARGATACRASASCSSGRRTPRGSGSALDEKEDAAERVHARAQLDQVVHFAESPECRRAALLAYFGEPREAGPCGGCDSCVAPRAAYDGTLEAQKLLSCVLRIEQRSGFSFGLAQAAAVLAGADTERVRRWGHETLSTFAIGREKSQKEWQAVGRELLRLGLLHQAEGRPGTITITPEGREILRRRATVMLTRTARAREAEAPAALPCDEALFASLRALRRALAEERAVPPYVIFPDSALLQMAREYPTDAAAFARISGVGDKKLADLGPAFMQAIAAHVAAHGRISGRAAAPPGAGPRSAP